MELITERVVAKLALTATVLAITIAFAVSARRSDPPYLFVHELIANGLQSRQGQELRLHGFVQGCLEAGSDTEHRFMLVNRGVGLRVNVNGALPDTFRDQAEVIVTGRLVKRGGWELDGTAVLAKCPGKYDGAPERLRPNKFE